MSDSYDVIVVGSGLAGASAAASLGELGYNVKCFCIQDSARRAHSIAAQARVAIAQRDDDEDRQNNAEYAFKNFHLSNHVDRNEKCRTGVLPSGIDIPEPPYYNKLMCGLQRTAYLATDDAVMDAECRSAQETGTRRQAGKKECGNSGQQSF